MPDPKIMDTGYEQVRRQLYLTETMTPRLREVMKKALQRLAEYTGPDGGFPLGDSS